MCNACAYLCCASDVLRECGCDGCRNADCWELCEDCGDDLLWGSCACDDEDEEYPDG